MSRHYHRRAFLSTSLAAMAALWLADKGCGPSPKVKNLGLQLYSVRDAFENAPEQTIRQLAGMGYSQLESYERNDDFFWGLGPKGFKKLMRELGMELLSSHCDPHKDFEKKAEMAAEAGMKFLVYNWPFAPQPLEEYRKKAELFNRCGETCARNGLKFGYHNYSSSYQLVDGIYPQDLLMDRTDPSLVVHQIDVYWVWRARQDPTVWMKKYPGRYQMSHMKDGNETETALLGTGSVDLAAIVKTGRETGMQYFIVEQEHYAVHDPVESARANAQYMKDILA